MVAAPAHGAARKAAGGELGGAHRTAAAEVQERPPGAAAAVDGQDRPGGRLDVDDVVVRAAVLVGGRERPPAGREREPAVAAGEVPEVGHGPSMAAARPNCAPLANEPGPSAVSLSMEWQDETTV